MASGRRDRRDRPGLDEYRERRDFARTPEPSGAGAERDGPGEDAPRFVIQQHSATRLHWDLRLEHDGVLLSWALPRGVPWDPGDNHLAVHTEDHPLEYLSFSGEIPEGSYGAGSMSIWDTGRYDPEKVTDREVIVTLAGERAAGRYALFRTRDRDWMIHRMDPPADPDRRHLPDRFEVIEPGEDAVPEGDGWAVETLWRGLRVVLTSSGGSVEVATPDGATIGERFPEVRRAGRALGMTEVALDGVLTAGEAEGAERIARRLAAGSDSTWRRLGRDAPVAFVAFDLLWLDGHSTAPLPWFDRRHLLEELDFDGDAWSTPRAYTGDPALLIEAAASSGVDRLVAKRVDAAYDPGLDPAPWHVFVVPSV
jgi:bifunctional non-homologous end joining protein LigD